MDKSDATQLLAAMSKYRFGGLSELQLSDVSEDAIKPNDRVNKALFNEWFVAASAAYEADQSSGPGTGKWPDHPVFATQSSIISTPDPTTPVRKTATDQSAPDTVISIASTYQNSGDNTEGDRCNPSPSSPVKRLKGAKDLAKLARASQIKLSLSSSGATHSSSIKRSSYASPLRKRKSSSSSLPHSKSIFLDSPTKELASFNTRTMLSKGVLRNFYASIATEATVRRRKGSRDAGTINYDFFCRHCNVLVTTRNRTAGSSSTGLIAHNETCTLNPDNKDRQQTLLSSGFTTRNSRGQPVLTTRQVRYNAVQIVTVGGSPFTIVDNPGFRSMASSGQAISAKVVPHRKLVQSDVKGFASYIKQKLTSLFADLPSSVHLGSDAWTAATGDSYIGFTAYYRDSGNVLRCHPIAFELENNPHTAPRLLTVLKKVVKDYNLQDKLFSVVADNASSNISMMRMAKQEKWKFSGHANGDMTIRCWAHTMALSVKAFVDVLADPLKTSKSDQPHLPIEPTTEASPSRTTSSIILGALDAVEVEDDDDQDEDDEHYTRPGEVSRLESRDAERLSAIARSVDAEVEADVDSHKSVLLRQIRQEIADLSDQNKKIWKQQTKMINKFGALTIATHNTRLSRLMWAEAARCVDPTLGQQDKAPRLPTFVKQRWSSTYKMLEAAQKYRPVIEVYVAQNRKVLPEDHLINETDWAMLGHVVKALKEPCDQTNKYSGGRDAHEYRTVADTLPDMVRLGHHYEAIARDSTAPLVIRAAACKAAMVMEKYYFIALDSSLMKWTILLHPSLRAFYAYQVLHWTESYIRGEISALFEYCKDHYAQNDLLVTPGTGASRAKSGPALQAAPWLSKRPSSHINTLEAWIRSQPEGDELLDAEGRPEGSAVKDALTYWGSKNSGPLHSMGVTRLALDLFSIPATSVDVERLFNYAGGFISDRRHSLHSDTSAALLMVSSSIRGGLVSGQDFERYALATEVGEGAGCWQSVD